MLAFQVRPWQVQSFVEPFKTKQDGFNLRLQDMSMDLDLLAVTVIYRYRFFGGSCSHFELANPDKWRVTHSTRPKRHTIYEMTSYTIRDTPMPPETVLAVQSPEVALREANRRYYAAFESLDITQMDEIWAHDDWVQCVHPGWDLLLGWAEVAFAVGTATAPDEAADSARLLELADQWLYEAKGR